MFYFTGMLAGITEGKMATTSRVTFSQDIHSPQVADLVYQSGQPPSLPKVEEATELGFPFFFFF